jgi:hypothetical protein
VGAPSSFSRARFSLTAAAAATVDLPRRRARGVGPQELLWHKACEPAVAALQSATLLVLQLLQLQLGDENLILKYLITDLIP